MITSVAAIITDLINYTLIEMPNEQDKVLSMLISFTKHRYLRTNEGKNLPISTPSLRRNPSPIPITRTLNLLLLGIEESGKSTLLATLGGTNNPNCKPTLGFRPMSLKYNEDVTIKLNDVGGKERIRGIWENYYHDSHGIIFVLDSSCSNEKFLETIFVAKTALNHNFLKSKPLLIICNKEDMSESRSIAVVREAFNFVEQSDEFHIVKTSIHPRRALSVFERDRTIDEAIEWTIETILRQVDHIEERIMKDTKEVNILRRKKQVSFLHVKKMRNECSEK